MKKQLNHLLNESENQMETEKIREHVSELRTKEDLELLEKAKEMGIDTVEELDNFIRARLMLKFMKVKATGYMTEKDKEMIEFGMKAIQIK